MSIDAVQRVGSSLIASWSQMVDVTRMLDDTSKMTEIKYTKPNFQNHEIETVVCRGKVFSAQAIYNTIVYKKTRKDAVMNVFQRIHHI